MTERLAAERLIALTESGRYGVGGEPSGLSSESLPIPSARSEKVPKADETLSANARTSRTCSDGNGPVSQGSGPLGQGSGPLGQGSGPLGERSGQSGYVTNGDSSPVPFVPPAFFNGVRWAGRGLGYLPDISDCHDHSLFDPDERRKLLDFYEALKQAVRDRSELHGDYQSPFKTEYLRQAFDLYGPLAAGQLSDAEIDSRRVLFCETLPRVNLGDSGCLTAVEDQGQIGSCTAHAVVGLAEYLIRAGTYETIDLSRLFLYKMTRNLMKVRGDTGAYIRMTIKAMASVGIPPETWWAYTPELLDTEPPPFPYALAANFKALTYKRIDDYHYSSRATLLLLLHVLAAGFPVAFGFPVYQSIAAASNKPAIIPVPGTVRGDKHIGGHAVLAVGYHATIEYVTELDDKKQPVFDRGALIIKNSWGEDWGDGGFAYLPFKYVLAGLALDFWTVFNSSWISEKRFAESELS